MTRKDFQVIAEILGYIKFAQEDFGKGIDSIQGGVDEYLRKTNPNYKPSRFWQAVDKAYNENVDLVKG